MVDPDLQIRGGGVHPDPEIRGGGGLWAPTLDPQLVLVTKLPPPRSSTKILDIALAWGLKTKIKKNRTESYNI